MAENEGWINFFESIINLLDEYELYWDTDDLSTRENITIRMDSVIVALQQVISSSSTNNLECMPFLECLLRNIRILNLDWIRANGNVSQCTRVAVYEVETPRVLSTATPGRPKLHISEDHLIQLRSFGFTWETISKMLLVSRWTVRRRIREFGIAQETGYSNVSDEDLDRTVLQFISLHGSLVGCSIVSGHLRSLGFRIQRRRVRKSIARVDPTNSHIRWAVTVSRRAYAVSGPNSLWHIDGHHSLVNWGFVIHGGIDGFSRLIVFLKCSTNNRSETMKQCFLVAIEQYHWPSRVRTDLGGENVGVWELMETTMGANRGSYLTGSSVHNQRIERLWRDVFCAVCHMYYYTFQAMEESGILQRSNNLHMFVLHYIYVPRINIALVTFTSAWNQHPMRTEHNWSPTQMWTNGMLDIRNHGRCGISTVTDSHISQVGDLQWYGFDPYAPRPDDDGLSTVELEDVAIDIDESTLELLLNHTDPLKNSDSFGIDLYQDVLSFLLSIGVTDSITL